MPRALPVVLATAAFVADLAGGHGFASACLLLAIPAAFFLLAVSYCDVAQSQGRTGRVVTAAFALILLVLSAAIRSPAVVGGVPRLAVSTLGLALVVFGAHAALRSRPAPQRIPRADRRRDDERERWREAA